MVYYQGLMVLALSEGKNTREYKGKIYEFDIWDGLLIPTDHVHHTELKNLFPFLKTHPFLKKWLFLPTNESFDTQAERVIGYVLKGPGLIGVEPKPRKARKPKKKGKNPFKGR